MLLSDGDGAGVETVPTALPDGATACHVKSVPLNESVTPLPPTVPGELSKLKAYSGSPPAVTCATLTPALAARWARLGSGTVCLVAASPASPDRLLAEARYVPTGAGAAELALTVRDGHQGAGLGGLLLEALVQRAREEGLERPAQINQ